MKFLIQFVVVFGVICSSIAGPIENSLEYGEHFQGDIKLTEEQEESLKTDGRNARTGILNGARRWPKINGRVTVPYTIDGTFSK